MTDYSVSTNILAVARALEKIAKEFQRMNDRNEQADAAAREREGWQ